MDEEVVELINQRDSLQVALRCHLVIESYLISLIEASLKIPDHFDADKISFPQKLGLAVALGAVDESFKGVMLCVNKIRNKFAHNLKYELEDKDIASMYALLGDAGKEALDGTAYHRMDNTGKLGGIFMILYAYLSSNYEEQAKNS